MKQPVRQVGVAAVMSLSLASALWQTCQTAAWSFDRTHKALTVELKKYTTNTGVHYRRWQKHPQNLENYLNSLGTITADEYDKMSADERAALWLDTYCALAIKVIIDHYPIDGKNNHYPSNSLRQIPNCWEADFINIAGRRINLWQIYHDVIRKDIKDIRTHFGIFSGAYGCSTQRAAYTGAKLDRQLEQAARKYLADKRNVNLDQSEKKIYVSQVFKWFPLDFASQAGFQKISFPPPTDDQIILGYLSLHGPKDVKQALAGVGDRSQYKVVYREFDWSLNDADGPPAKMPQPLDANAPPKVSRDSEENEPAGSDTASPKSSAASATDAAPTQSSAASATDAAPVKSSAASSTESVPAK